MSQVDSTTFLYSAPLWALDATYQAGLVARDVTEAKITAKQAVLTFADGSTVKVFRRHAFPGRQSV
jgi:hypothetical protein